MIGGEGEAKILGIISIKGVVVLVLSALLAGVMVYALDKEEARITTNKKEARCQPYQCVKADGKCGAVNLEFWCTNLNGSRHGCGYDKRPAPHGETLRSPPTDATVGDCKRVAARWYCE